MKDETIEVPSTATSVINYIFNKYMPFICVSILVYYSLGLQNIVSYIILGLMWFSSIYSFKCGIAHAICCELDEDSEF